MTSNNFRREKKKHLRDLLDDWREIERWIKKAEQVNKKAVVPAINELRYAARQLFYGTQLLAKRDLSEGDKSSISKRFIIADQYLMNADHDIVDSIVGFYSKAIALIDQDVGISKVAAYFPGYPQFRAEVHDLEAQISGSRHDASERRVNYRDIRENHLENLIQQFKLLVDAEVQARAQQEELKLQLVDAQNTQKNMHRFNVACGIATLISLVFSIWVYFTPATMVSDVEKPVSQVQETEK